MAKSRNSLGVALFVCWALLEPAWAAQVQREERTVAEVKAIRATQPIRLDGHLDDTAWSDAVPATSFRQRDPDEGKPATERTELRLAYDDDALFVGVRLFDVEPTRIVRRLTRRDDWSDGDRFALYLDPHHDHLTGAEFVVTAAGVQGDAAIFNDSWNDDTWDAVWEAAVSVDSEGWSVEMRIPLTQIRFPAAEAHTWGINAERFVQRKNETSWLELVPKKESGLASRMGHLTGLDGIHPHRGFAAVPYVVTRGELIEPSAGDPFNDGSRTFGSMGLDVKYGVTSNLTLDATVNPDFGQVEVDPAVVNLTEFETFFQEKRPFFTEGAQIVSNFGRNGANNFWGFNRSEPDLFYSRRIGRSPQGETDADFVDRPQATTILGAAKLTGKTAKGWSLTAIDAVTARERARIETGGVTQKQLIEPLTNSFVGRAHRDLGRAGIGFLTTAVLRDLAEPSLAELLSRRAFVAGVDGYRFLNAKKDWVVAGRFAASRVEGSAAAMQQLQEAPQHYFQRPDADRVRLDRLRTSLSGWTGSVNLNRNSGDLQANAALWATSPGFESNDLGFNYRSDRLGGHVVGTWRKTNPDRYTRRRSFSIAKWYALDFDGDRQGDGIHVFANAQLRNYWSIGGNAFKRFRAWNDQLTRGGPKAINPAGQGGGMWAETDTRKRISASLEGYYNTNEYGGHATESFASIRLKPGAGLSLQLGPSLIRTKTVAQYVTSVEDASARATFGSRYVFGGLHQTEVAMSTRINWIVSPRMSLQIFAQPLVSSGDYSGFKELARPASYDFTRYGVDAGRLAYDATARQYTADADASGPAPAFTFDDPDFNFKSLRVNAVFRWEWRLGSTLFVVWTQGRVDETHPGEFDLARDVDRLFRARGDDVFQVKFTYRIGR